jgi:hypothetical protein
MDDFNTNLLSEARNEYSSRLLNILTPLVLQGFRSIFNEAYQLCLRNDENMKYLMTFQNFLARVPKWNQDIIEVETERIIKTSKCSYLEDILSCVHITQLKILTSIRVSSKQKKIEIDIPKLSSFVHRVYIESARKIYQNVYLFEKFITPLQQQKNMRECEIIIRECILKVISDSMPIEKILRAYMDETEEEEIVEETVDKPIEEVKELLKEELETSKLEEERKEAERKEAENSNVVNSVSHEEQIDNNAIAEQPIVDNSPIVVDTESVTSALSPVAPALPISTVETIKPVEESSKISFDNNDSVMNYVTDEEPKTINTSETTLISAPKTIERLERISREQNEKRKMEEEDDDDIEFENDKITIFNDTPKLELDNLDVHSLDEPLKLNNDIVLDDIEELK